MQSGTLSGKTLAVDPVSALPRRGPALRPARPARRPTAARRRLLEPTAGARRPSLCAPANRRPPATDPTGPRRPSPVGAARPRPAGRGGDGLGLHPPSKLCAAVRGGYSRAPPEPLHTHASRPRPASGLRSCEPAPSHLACGRHAGHRCLRARGLSARMRRRRASDRRRDARRAWRTARARGGGITGRAGPTSARRPGPSG